MTSFRQFAVVGSLALAPALLAAQGSDVEARLEARGLPSGLAHQVAAVAANAAADGLPTGPIADKAIEGWAKQVPLDRIVAACTRFSTQMAGARDAVRSAGVAQPSGPVIAAAAEAMRSGMQAAEVRAVVQAAGDGAVAAPGLSVAAALHAQGLGGDQAVKIVVGAMHAHRGMAELLDLPSMARAMHDQGMSAGDIEHRILDGGEDHDGDGTRSGTRINRPPTVPPGTGHDWGGHDGHHGR